MKNANFFNQPLFFNHTLKGGIAIGITKRNVKYRISNDNAK